MADAAVSGKEKEEGHVRQNPTFETHELKPTALEVIPFVESSRNDRVTLSPVLGKVSTVLL